MTKLYNYYNNILCNFYFAYIRLLEKQQFLFYNVNNGGVDMSEKLLSIILPAYNAEKQLKELLTAYFAVNRTILSLLLLTTDQRTPQMILSEAITIRDFL